LHIHITYYYSQTGQQNWTTYLMNKIRSNDPPNILYITWYVWYTATEEKIKDVLQEFFNDKWNCTVIIWYF
jgi:hypothetical protein